MSVLITILTIIHVFVSLFIVLLVMMQRPKQEGLGAAFGGGAMDGAFGAQTTNVLQKGTLYFGIAFFILSLALAVLIGRTAKPSTGLSDSLKDLPEAVEAPAATTTEEGAAVPIIPALPTPQPAAEATPAPETPAAETPVKEAAAE